jgi:uncharacterized protein YukE
MADSKFVSVDTSKITKFKNDSKDAIKEFKEIKKEFKRINKELLAAWEGEGAEAYKFETDNILEKIKSVDDVLDAINNGAVSEIRQSYSDMDDEMGEYNKNPYPEEDN